MMNDTRARISAPSQQPPEGQRDRRFVPGRIEIITLPDDITSLATPNGTPRKPPKLQYNEIGLDLSLSVEVLSGFTTNDLEGIIKAAKDIITLVEWELRNNTENKSSQGASSNSAIKNMTKLTQRLAHEIHESHEPADAAEFTSKSRLIRGSKGFNHSLTINNSGNEEGVYDVFTSLRGKLQIIHDQNAYASFSRSGDDNSTYIQASPNIRNAPSESSPQVDTDNNHSKLLNEEDHEISEDSPQLPIAVDAISECNKELSSRTTPIPSGQVQSQDKETELPYPDRYNFRNRSGKNGTSQLNLPSVITLPSVIKENGKRKRSSGTLAVNGSRSKKSQRSAHKNNIESQFSGSSEGIRSQRSIWEMFLKVGKDDLAIDEDLRKELERHRFRPLELVSDRAQLLFPGVDSGSTYDQMMNGRVNYLMSISAKVEKLDWMYVIGCMIIDNWLTIRFHEIYGRSNISPEMVKSVFHDRYKDLVDEELEQKSRRGRRRPDQGKMSPSEAKELVKMWRNVGLRGWWLFKNVCPGVVLALSHMGIPRWAIESAMPLSDKQGMSWVRRYDGGVDKRLKNSELGDKENHVLKAIKMAADHLIDELNIVQILGEQGLNLAVESIFCTVEKTRENLVNVPQQ